MRLLLLSLVAWSLSACSAVTVSVRGEATLPMAYSRPSFATTPNGAQVIGRTNDASGSQPIQTITLAIRNSRGDRLMEVDPREMTLVAPDGATHLVRRSLRAGESDDAITVPPLQTARLEVTPADGSLPMAPPTKTAEAGAILSAGTLRVPVRVSGQTETAELSLAFSTEADIPSDLRPRMQFSYATRIPFEPGLAGLLGTMCFVTASYFGGLCWLYLIFPTPSQKDRALQEAEQSLKQQYGPGAAVVSSEIQQIGW